MLKENGFLENYFHTKDHRRIFKWQHYFEIYERHFERFRNRKVNIVEIGVLHGGSLQMWKDYFGPSAHIYGIDINPKCKEFEEENIRIFTGSQSDRAFLSRLRSEIPSIDILIDDGGHTMEQQIATFEELFHHISSDGVYLCEDLHTSYWEDYGGGYKKENSFIEYSKNFIDYLNAFHSKDDLLQPNSFTRSAHSVHFYDSILVIEKRKKAAPVALKSGKKSL